MKVTYYGQSSFLIQIAGKNIVLDPFISPNELAKGVDVDKIEADYILISHGHGDHVADLIDMAKRTGALVISSYEIIEWLAKKGINNGHPMNIGGTKHLDWGSVKMMYACHSNSLPDGSYGGTAAGFMIKSEGKTIYYSGDTSLMAEMKLTGELFDIDHAFLPIGDNFTMGVDDAIIASGFIRCKNIIGMHYDTFPYIEIDKQEAIEKFKTAGLDLRLLAIGVETAI